MSWVDCRFLEKFSPRRRKLEKLGVSVFTEKIGKFSFTYHTGISQTDDDRKKNRRFIYKKPCAGKTSKFKKLGKKSFILAFLLISKSPYDGTGETPGPPQRPRLGPGRWVARGSPTKKIPLAERSRKSYFFGAKKGF